MTLNAPKGVELRAIPQGKYTERLARAEALESEGDMAEWVASAKRGDVALYHSGERPPRRLEDIPPTQKEELLARLLFRMAYQLYEADAVTLYQQRIPRLGFDYLMERL